MFSMIGLLILISFAHANRYYYHNRHLSREVAPSPISHVEVEFTDGPNCGGEDLIFEVKQKIGRHQCKFNFLDSEPGEIIEFKPKLSEYYLILHYQIGAFFISKCFPSSMSI